MQIKVGDVKAINNEMAIVTEIIDPSQSKDPKCFIQQKGEKYCVLISDLKSLKTEDKPWL